MSDAFDTVQVDHQFDSPTQQRESLSLGMWLFLVTEVMFFGGIFVGYAVYRNMYPDMFHHMSHHLNVYMGGLNTAVLLTSSLTMAFAVNAAHNGNRKRLVSMLIITFLASLVFLVVKYFEYAEKFHHGLVPGKNFHLQSEYGDTAQLFFGFYFAATGLHGFHVLCGTVMIGIFAWMAHKGRFLGNRAQPVEMLGLYWHFVDLVWIYVFPLFYLIGLT
jgi:cytochrome c oxidase subunit III